MVAQRKLSEGKHQDALPAAQFCLRCSIDVHGPSSVQMVPAYLLLADANMGEEGAQNGFSAQIVSFLLMHDCVCVCVHMCVFILAFPGLGNLALVAEFLSQAEWAVLKSPECGRAVHHRLHRSLGRLHMATGNLEAALLNFANDVCVIISTLTRNGFSTCNTFIGVVRGKMKATTLFVPFA